MGSHGDRADLLHGHNDVDAPTQWLMDGRASLLSESNSGVREPISRSRVLSSSHSTGAISGGGSAAWTDNHFGRSPRGQHMEPWVHPPLPKRQEAMDLLEEFNMEPNFDRLKAMIAQGISPRHSAASTAKSSIIPKEPIAAAPDPPKARRDDSKESSDAMKAEVKFLKDQSAMLAQQLIDMQRQFDDLKRNTESAVSKLQLQSLEVSRDVSRAGSTVDTIGVDSEGRIKGFVRQLFEKMETSVNKLRNDYDHLAQKCDSNESDLYRRLELVSDDVARSISLPPSMRQSPQTQMAVPPRELKEYMQKAAEEMKAGWDQMLEHHRKVKECLERETRERMAASDDLEKMLLAIVEKDRKDRDMHQAKFHAHLSAVAADVEAHRGELPQLQRKLRSLEDKLQTQIDTTSSTIESHLSHILERMKETERRIDIVQTNVAQEAIARNSMGEVFENIIKQERLKTTQLITQRLEVARQETEEMMKALSEKIDKERTDREAHLEEIQELYGRHKTAVHDRISSIENDTQTHEQNYHALFKEVRAVETAQRKLEDELGTGLRDTRRELTDAILVEKNARLDTEKSIEEQLIWLGEHHDKMRDLVVQRGPRRSILGGGSSPSSHALATRS